MLSFAGNIVVFFIVFILSYRMAEISPNIGYMAYYYLSIVPRVIPLIGNIYNKGTGSILHITFLYKFSSFVIGSSGILFLPLCLQYIYPELLERHDFLYGLFAAASFTTLRIMEKVHLMDAPDVQAQLRIVMNQLNVDTKSLDERVVARILRAQYTDIVGVDFLTIIVCYGISAFCESKLGLAISGSKVIDSPLEGVLESLTFLRFVASSTLSLSGPWAIGLNVFYGTCLFICLVFFVSLSSKLIDIKPIEITQSSDPHKDLKEKLLSLMKPHE